MQTQNQFKRFLYDSFLIKFLFLRAEFLPLNRIYTIPIYKILQRMITKRIFGFCFSTHTKYCIIGGGTGGLSMASHLLRSDIKPTDLRIFEPAEYHYYQPGWTMVGADITDPEVTRRPMDEVLPAGVPRVKENVAKIDPENNQVTTQAGHKWTYDHLIVAAGFKLDWHKIQGARQLLSDHDSNVTSIYDYNYAVKTSRIGKHYKGGNAIFTEPALPIKCAGAPQKILYLWSDIWRKNNINTSVQYVKNGGVMFGVPKYSKSLETVAANFGIRVTFKHNLVEVTKDTATFEHIESKQRITKNFNFLHIVPPMSPPAFIKQSGIANEAGFVDVDKHTMRHNKYPNIWSLGDCSSLPNSKTAAAIFSQTIPLYHNLLAVSKNPNLKQLPEKYDGYASCPLFTSNDDLMLAEFKYDGVIDETFFNDQEKPRKMFYYLKKYFFPLAYWQLVPKGLWNGRKGIRFI